ncbi:MAG: hypothetical protein JXR68_04535 [Bacteroidales bacterium]|nr:hypothetical protein [Bacteroidales bacterium]
MNTLLTVGSVAFDQIETPWGNSDIILGGAGTYISLAASNFNIKSNLVSVVGGDFTENYLDVLRNHNVDITGIEKKKDEKTFFWHGRYHKNMNERDSIATELNSLGSFEPVVPTSYQNADILMLGNLTPVVQRKVIEQLNNRPNLIVMDTMNFWMNTMLDELHRTISMVDVLTVNDEEARQLSGEFFLPVAAKKIIKMGPRIVIIKKGEHGALIFNKDDVFFAPALPLSKVADPTGAGDSFAGGFVGYLAQTNDYSFENMKNAVIVGSAVASLSVQEFGTKKLQDLPKEELNARIDIFRKLTAFNLPKNIF